MPSCSVSRRLRAMRLSMRMFAVALVLVASAGAQESPPRVFLLRAENLALTKSRLQAGDAELAPAYAKLREDAAKALAAVSSFVTDKKQIASSDDKHDYVSFGPYWWPDSSKPNGLPFIRRDGNVNPASREDADRPRFARMADVTGTLALAYYLSGDEAYATRATQLLRAWFLDSATRMNPNLRFGQAIPGITEGRGIGLIDTRELSQIVDAVGLLQGSPSWSAADQRGMLDWARAFLRWMTTSQQGRDEAAAKNNHGTWYDAQAASLALFVGDTALARDVLGRQSLRRIDSQIQPDGRQPAELARTRSLSYSQFNLEAFTRIAELARPVGVDVWHYTA